MHIICRIDRIGRINFRIYEYNRKRIEFFISLLFDSYDLNETN